ncbi:MAG: 50S ribosomal protein L3 [Tenericutes bacterium]|nr:50S ribosomal protein L3 [Mycoplasmatota bacterium]
MKGILGRKVGMTEVFTTDGKLIPVTVVEVEPNVITQIKTVEKDGYNSIQLGAFTKREKVSNKPEMGHIKKANTTPKRFLKEIKGLDIANYEVGQVIGVDVFEAGELVDVTGTSKGKGFQGTIKRHNFSRGPMSHGSHYHRAVGSRGPMRPMRVLKGKKLPGHMGNETVTIQNLEIIAVDVENSCLLISGNVPGPKKGYVLVRTAIKNGGKVEAKELVSYIVEEVVENNEVVTEELTETVENNEVITEETTENTPEKEETE